MTQGSGESTRRVRRGAGWATLIELPSLRLHVLSPGEPRRIDVDHAAIRLGSAGDNDVVIQEQTVSRAHARLTRVENGWTIADLGSSNGTFVDGVRIKEAYVSAGADIRLGAARLRIEPRTEQYYAVADEGTNPGPLVGRSAEMREVYGLIRAVAPTSTSVLVEGESGTGKELVARAIHELSGRTGPLVVFDAASTGPDLIRSELFGHVRGAFTGAAEEREGAFRRAHRGTLFIDEFGELPLALQPHLLRVLETREITPIGADRSVPVDVRVVVATNADLRRSVESGRFRADLYHRVAVLRIALPALRERREDIRLLVTHYAERLATGIPIGEDVLSALEAHDWPGNVRALRNAVERVGVVARGRAATIDDFDLHAFRATPEVAVPAERGPGVDATPAARGSLRLREVEEQTIREALVRTGGNKAAAARLLGIALSTLKRKLAGEEPDER